MKWNCDLKWNWAQLNFCFENNHVVCRFHCIFRYIRNCKKILLHCCLIMNFFELLWSSHALLAIVKHHFVIHIKFFQQSNDANETRNLKKIKSNVLRRIKKKFDVERWMFKHYFNDHVLRNFVMKNDFIANIVIHDIVKKLTLFASKEICIVFIFHF